jgi:hypothetical protein
MDRWTKLSNLYKKPRSTDATSMIELMCGLIMVVPFILLFVDLTFVYEGVSQNIAVCREAARAAASGPPNALSPGAPKARVETILKPYCLQAGPLRFNPECSVTETISQSLPQPPLGGPVEGTVTVRTTVEIFMPFILKIFYSPGGMKFTATETLPYSYAMPASQPASATTGTNR